jgi:protein phosphatase
MYKWEVRGDSRNKKLDPKHQNEDYFYCDENMALIADGVSGRTGGHIASKIAVNQGKEELSNLLKSSLDENEVNPAIEEIIQKLNSSIYEEGLRDISKEGMRTTFSLALKYKDRLYIGSVGDSPVLIYKDNKITKITKDDTSLGRKFEDSLTDEEYLHKIHTEDDRIINVLGLKRPVNVQIYEIPLEGVEYILLLTDGVKNLITQSELEIISEEDSQEEILNKIFEVISNPEKVAEIAGKDPEKIANKDDSTIIVIKSYEVDKNGT